MEAIERAEGEAVVNFQVGDREKETPSAPGIVTTRSDTVRPPPYDSGLGFFGSSLGDNA